MVCHLICRSANKSPNQVLGGLFPTLKLRFRVTKMQLLWSYRLLKKNIPNGMFFSNRSLLPKNAFYRKPIPINKKRYLLPPSRHPVPIAIGSRRAQRSHQPPPKYNSSEATLLILKSDSYQFFKNTSFPLCPYFK
jgi:hypothetical protein